MEEKPERYFGTFCVAKGGGGYGFFINPKDIKGNPPPDLPAGKCIFLCRNVARETLKGVRKPLDKMGTGFFSFYIRKSEKCPGKLEAYNVQCEKGKLPSRGLYPVGHMTS